MSDHYLVMREKDAQDPKAAIHVKAFSQEGPARSYAEEKSKSKPGVRYVVYELLDGCVAHVSPADWDSTP